MALFRGALLCGQLSRSESAANAHRRLRDGLGARQEFEKALEEDRRQIIAAQENFAFVSGGQADWLDLLRPIAKMFTGFEKRNSAGEDAVGPVTRWFRTNTFYRKPTVSGKIECTGNELAAALPTLERGVVFMLGPYSFSRLVEDSFYHDAGRLASDYSDALAKCLPAVKEKGYACVLLLEPAVGYDISREAFDQPPWYSGCVSLLKASGMKLGIHFPLADAAKALPLAEDTGADLVGVDCVYSQPKSVHTSKDVLFGIVDSARAKVETTGEIAGITERFVEGAEFSGSYYLGCSDRLFDVPFNIALKKIKALSEVGGLA